MARRTLLLSVALTLACGTQAPGPIEPKEPPAREVLYLQEGDKIRVRDAATGDVHAEAPTGLLSPDWNTVYVVRNGTSYSADAPEGRTTVHAMEVFGETLRSVDLPGEFVMAKSDPSGRLTGLSHDGRTLVLPQRQGNAPTATRFAVLDTAFEAPPRFVDLPGHFSFDALSPDGKGLYLIEHMADAASAYRVRRYALATGTLDPQPIVLKGANPHESMQGSPASQVSSPGGEWVYTLYSNYRKGPFIHALQTNGAGIACINLGSDWRTEPRDEAEFAWSMALSPDARTLYVANAALGVAASVDALKHFGVIHRTKLPQPAVWAIPTWFRVPVAEAKPHVRGGAAVSPDGGTLYVIGRKGLTALNAGNLSVTGTFLPDRTLTSIAVSPDGKRLYAAEAGGRLLRIDAASGAVSGEVATRGSFGAILQVAPAG